MTLIEKPYEEGVLEGARVVYACTDDRNINRKIAADAKRRNILACVADDPEFCDFIPAAIYKKDFIRRSEFKRAGCSTIGGLAQPDRGRI